MSALGDWQAAAAEAELVRALILGPYGDYWIEAGRPGFSLRALERLQTQSRTWVLGVVAGPVVKVDVSHRRMMFARAPEEADAILVAALNQLMVQAFPTPRHLALVRHGGAAVDQP